MFCARAHPALAWSLQNQIVVSDHSQMDRIFKEERDYILDLCKKIKASGCNVLLVQKSILRDAVNGACARAHAPDTQAQHPWDARAHASAPASVPRRVV
ncbi:hypothetical protein EON66_09750 [archaeon]|nr:MAG: hypothetical protein EON66_09750 [archaeon]